MEEARKEGLGNDLTQGSVAKQLIRFSIPLIGAYLLQSLYSMVDMGEQRSPKKEPARTAPPL